MGRGGGDDGKGRVGGWRAESWRMGRGEWRMGRGGKSGRMGRRGNSGRIVNGGGEDGEGRVGGWVGESGRMRRWRGEEGGEEGRIRKVG